MTILYLNYYSIFYCYNLIVFITYSYYWTTPVSTKEIMTKK